MKTLAKLQAECAAVGINVEVAGRSRKEPFIAALRSYHWEKDFPGKPLPVQLSPMLLTDWGDLPSDQAQEIEQDNHAWIVQRKFDGVRALLHIDEAGVRITSRCISEVSYRLCEFTPNLLHLAQGFSELTGTIFDGELVCPVPVIDTGNTITSNALQAAVAILSTTAGNAQQIQVRQGAHLRLYVFDILQYRGTDVTQFPLRERLNYLVKALQAANNPYLELVPSFVINKARVHRTIIEDDGEGTCWKNLDEPYQMGLRSRAWIKRKRGIEIEATVTGFKAGTNGHTNLIGCVEFSIQQGDGSTVPIAWVNSFTREEREAMTFVDSEGKVALNDFYMGRKALIQGHDLSAKSRRIRHAKIRRWLHG